LQRPLDAGKIAKHPLKSSVSLSGEVKMGWFSKSTDGFFLSTTTPPDIVRSQYLGVVNGEAVIGANIFRDMFASVRDVVGGRAGGYERALAGARDAAIEGLVEAARELGANGVIGIDFDYEVLGETNGMMMVAVSGTAIKFN
jgi:uncharacterized protein YbjQ (UPF0145 family)